MISVTKIFRFEMAHAIHGYAGSCRNLHGHSYILHVTVVPAVAVTGAIPAPGFIIDFKELKQRVQASLIDKLDHRVLLSEAWLAAHPAFREMENLWEWKEEPTAENILLHIRQVLSSSLPATVRLQKLKLFETNDSYAEWVNPDLV